MPITTGTINYTTRIPQWRLATHRQARLGAPTVVDDSTSATLLIGQTSKSWQKDTDWKVKVAKRQNAAMPYLRSKWIYNIPYDLQGTGSVSYVDGWNYEVFIRRITSFSTGQIFGTTDSVLADQALARYKRKLSGKLGEAQALVPTVELRELRQTIGATTDLSWQLVSALAKARKTRGRSLVKFAQDKWLAYSFGVAPLISDTMQILTSIENYLERPKGLHRIRSSATKRWNSRYKSVISVPWGFDTEQYASIENQLTYTIDSGIDFSILAGNDYSLANHLGFENFGQQLPSIAWELMPFSWVFDYFTTIGAYLEDTFVFPPGSTKYLTRTRKYIGTGYEIATIGPRAGSSLWSDHSILQSCQPGGWQFMITQREVLTALPHRSLRFKTLDEVGRNAVSRLLNLCALHKLK